MQKWYILQTRPRWEKKVTDCLEQKGIVSFCPIKKVKRKWSDRIKTLEEPVFRAYVFVKISAEQRTVVRLTNGVMNFVNRNGKPALMREKQMLALKKKLALMNTVQNEKLIRGETYQRPNQTYLDNFNEWLRACIERPKLV